MLITITPDTYLKYELVTYLLKYKKMDEILTPEQWYELKSRIRNQYPELTDNDLQYHEASEKDLLTMVRYSIVRTKEIMTEALRSPNHLSPLKNYWRYIRKRRSKIETE